MIDAKIKIHCTDRGKDIDAHVLNFKEKQFLEVAISTVKVRMSYMNNAYVGSMAGLEFVVKEDQLPKPNKEYRR